MSRDAAITQELLSKVETLLGLVDQIRGYVNRPRTKSALFADTPRFSRACSAMDMLGDTSQALRSYLHATSENADNGRSYLLVFGALQALYVQQDATFWLCKALGFPSQVSNFTGPEKWIHADGNKELSKVRNLRNSSVGHPVNRTKGLAEDHGSYFINQMSLRSSGFRMLARSASGKSRWIDVPVVRLVEVQLDALTTAFRSALREIEVADRSHRERFAGEQLEDLFRSLDYPVEKLHEAAKDAPVRSLGMYGVEAVRRVMVEFRQALAGRDEPFAAGLEYLYDLLDDALNRLGDFYESRAGDGALAGLLAIFVADRVEELRSWARSMDESYAVAPVSKKPRPSGRLTAHSGRATGVKKVRTVR
jgi:hypothetical protein